MIKDHCFVQLHIQVYTQAHKWCYVRQYSSTNNQSAVVLHQGHMTVVKIICPDSVMAKISPYINANALCIGVLKKTQAEKALIMSLTPQ